MPPPRSVRLLSETSAEPDTVEVHDAMRSYAEKHQVHDMLQIVMARLLATQPLDPIEFLINTLRTDVELDDLEQRARRNRFDLRREQTKRKLVVAFYKRLMALQRVQHDDKVEACGADLSLRFLLLQLRLAETRTYLHKAFPKHYRDIIQSFILHEKELPPMLTMDRFTRQCMRVLATLASA